MGIYLCVFVFGILAAQTTPFLLCMVKHYVCGNLTIFEKQYYTRSCVLKVKSYSRSQKNVPSLMASEPVPFAVQLLVHFCSVPHACTHTHTINVVPLPTAKHLHDVDQVGDQIT